MNDHSPKDTDLSLFRGNQSSEIETLFIIGNGAIQNGEMPLARALKELQSKNFFIFDPELLGSIPSLSCVSEFESSLFENLILHLKGALPNLASDGTSSGFELCTWNLCAYSFTFRNILAESYQKHRNSLHVRGPMWSLLEEQGINDSSSACITTNWDDILWRQLQIKNIAHLHGHCDHPISLILPTETISRRALRGNLIGEIQERLDELAKKERNESIVNTIKYYYSVSTDSIVPQMFGIENLFGKWLNSAKKIVIAGLRFNDYDHELMSTIAKYANRKKYQKIVLINRIKNQKSKVDKIAGLFSCLPSDITFLNAEGEKSSLNQESPKVSLVERLGS